MFNTCSCALNQLISNPCTSASQDYGYVTPKKQQDLIASEAGGKSWKETETTRTFVRVLESYGCHRLSFTHTTTCTVLFFLMQLLASTFLSVFARPPPQAPTTLACQRSNRDLLQYGRMMFRLCFAIHDLTIWVSSTINCAWLGTICNALEYNSDVALVCSRSHHIFMSWRFGHHSVIIYVYSSGRLVTTWSFL